MGVAAELLSGVCDGLAGRGDGDGQSIWHYLHTVVGRREAPFVCLADLISNSIEYDLSPSSSPSILGQSRLSLRAEFEIIPEV